MHRFRCPNCASEVQRAPEGCEEGMEPTGCAIFLFGGLVAGMIYGLSRRERIQCPACGHYSRPPLLPSSRLTAGLLWLLVLALIVVVVWVVVDLSGWRVWPMTGFGPNV